jgi:hypothetical protein
VLAQTPEQQLAGLEAEAGCRWSERLALRRRASEEARRKAAERQRETVPERERGWAQERERESAPARSLAPFQK